MLAQQLAFSVGSGAGGAREQRRGRRRPLPGRTRRARSRRRAARLVEDDTGHRVLIYATESGVKNLTRWPGWQAIPHQILRPQRHNQRRLPRRLGARQAVSHLRDRAALPGADQGFQYRHGAPENARRARRAGRVPLAAREIRTSIQNSYREVLRRCTLRGDYDGSSEAAHTFFAEMENRLLWRRRRRPCRNWCWNVAGRA